MFPNRFVSLPLFLSVSLMAQMGSPGQISILKGEIEADVRLGNDFVVDLQDCQRQFHSERAHVSSTGEFEFRNVGAGCYLIKVVVALRGESIHEEIVNLQQHSSPLRLRLPKSKKSLSAAGKISVKELQNPIPKKAFRAFVDAQNHSEAGHAGKAVEKLKLAIKLYAAYRDALMNLGVQYVRAGEVSSALEEFQKALEIGPDNSALEVNTALALFIQKRYEEAEHCARQAVVLDLGDRKAHYMLGSILSKQAEKDAEALEHLRVAELEIPKARLAIAHIRSRAGDTTGAAWELREYLKSGNQGDRGAVESWLTRLKADKSF